MYLKVQELIVLAKHRIPTTSQELFSEFYIQSALKLDKTLYKLRAQHEFSLEKATEFVVMETRKKYDLVWSTYLECLEKKQSIENKPEGALLSPGNRHSVPVTQNSQSPEATKVHSKLLTLDSGDEYQLRKYSHALIPTHRPQRQTKVFLLANDTEAAVPSSGLNYLISPQSQSKAKMNFRQRGSSKNARSVDWREVNGSGPLSPTIFQQSQFKAPISLFEANKSPRVVITGIEQITSRQFSKEDENSKKINKFLFQQTHVRANTEKTSLDPIYAQKISLPSLRNLPELRESILSQPRNSTHTETQHSETSEFSSPLSKKLSPTPVPSDQSKCTMVESNGCANAYDIIGEVKVKVMLSDPFPKPEQRIEKLYSQLIEMNEQIKKTRELFFTCYYQKHAGVKPSRAPRKKAIPKLKLKIKKTFSSPTQKKLGVTTLADLGVPKPNVFKKLFHSQNLTKDEEHETPINKETRSEARKTIDQVESPEKLPFGAESSQERQVSDSNQIQQAHHLNTKPEGKIYQIRARGLDKSMSSPKLVMSKLQIIEKTMGSESKRVKLENDTMVTERTVINQTRNTSNSLEVYNTTLFQSKAKEIGLQDIKVRKSLMRLQTNRYPFLIEPQM